MTSKLVFILLAAISSPSFAQVAGLTEQLSCTAEIENGEVLQYLSFDFINQGNPRSKAVAHVENTEGIALSPWLWLQSSQLGHLSSVYNFNSFGQKLTIVKSKIIGRGGIGRGGSDINPSSIGNHVYTAKVKSGAVEIIFQCD
jgi:hypothetical protein